MSLSKKEGAFLLVLLIVAVIFQLIVLYVMPISISNDSYGYLHLAMDPLDETLAFERSIGYPLLLAITGVHLFDTLIFIVWIQCLMAISLPIVMYFTLRPLGKFYGTLGSLFMLLFLFSYYASNQIMTELSYMFSLSIFAYFSSRYFFNRSYANALLVTLSLVWIALVRVSSDVQFLGLAIGCVLMIAFEWFRQRKFNQIALGTFAFICMVFGFLTFANNHFWDRNASTATPHFVWNWVYKDGQPLQYGIVRPENGPISSEFFNTLREVISTEPHAFKMLASSGSAEVQALGSAKADFDETDVDKLMDELIHNTKHDFRSWWIEGLLNSRLGIPETARLLGGTIKEAFWANPHVLVQRTFTVFERVEAYFFGGVTPNPVLLPSSYFHQVPTSPNFHPAVQKGIFAEWINGMYSQVGTNKVWQEKLGGYPTKWPEAKEALGIDQNYIAFGHYLVVKSLQIVRPLWLILALSAVFFFWSPNIGFAASMVSVSFATPFLAVFISETDPRHLIMSYPLQVVAAMIGLSGIVGFVKKGLASNILSVHQVLLGRRLINWKILARYLSMDNARKLVLLGGIAFALLVGFFLVHETSNQLTTIVSKTVSSDETPLEDIWIIQNGVSVETSHEPGVASDKKSIHLNETADFGEHFVATNQLDLAKGSLVVVHLKLRDVSSKRIALYLSSNDGNAFAEFDLNQQRVVTKHSSDSLIVSSASVNKNLNDIELYVQFEIKKRISLPYLRFQFVRDFSQGFVGDPILGTVISHTSYEITNQ